MSAPEAWLAVVTLGIMGYAIGSLSAGYVVGRAYRGVDLRAIGSGSTGATNALRALGPGAALTVALADIAKGALAVWIAGLLTGAPSAEVAAEGDHWIEVGPRGTVQAYTWVAHPRAG